MAQGVPGGKGQDLPRLSWSSLQLSFRMMGTFHQMEEKGSVSSVDVMAAALEVEA